jgi:hypothetical protein
MRNHKKMIPSKDQIELMDKVLLFISNKNEERELDAYVLAKEFNISTDFVQNAINKVCEIAHNENILVAEKMGYGNYFIVSKNFIDIETFINQGGFEEYFRKLSGNDKSPERSFTIINSGSIQNIAKSVGNNNYTTTTAQNNLATESPKSKIKKIIEYLSWIAVIIGTIITIYLVFRK